MSIRTRLSLVPGAALTPIAAIFGIAGAALLASNVAPGWGFGAFLVSNFGWLTLSAARRQWSMFVQQIAFVITSLVGLWNWWLGPLLIGGAA